MIATKYSQDWLQVWQYVLQFLCLFFSQKKQVLEAVAPCHGLTQLLRDEHAAKYHEDSKPKVIRFCQGAQICSHHTEKKSRDCGCCYATSVHGSEIRIAWPNNTDPKNGRVPSNSVSSVTINFTHWRSIHISCTWKVPINTCYQQEFHDITGPSSHPIPPQLCQIEHIVPLSALGLFF